MFLLASKQHLEQNCSIEDAEITPFLQNLR